MSITGAGGEREEAELQEILTHRIDKRSTTYTKDCGIHIILLKV